MRAARRGAQSSRDSNGPLSAHKVGCGSRASRRIAIEILEDIHKAIETATTHAVRDACIRAAQDVQVALSQVHTGLAVPRADSRADDERGLLGR